MDEIDAQKDPFEELSSVTNTQDDGIGNVDEVEENTNVQTI